MRDKEGRTWIGILSSQDWSERSRSLVTILDEMVERKPALLEKFHFVFTGGTYARVVDRSQGSAAALDFDPVSETTRNFLINRCGILVLPENTDGGVIILSSLIVQRKISVLWPFFTPLTNHWLSPQSQALMRLCDHWHVKRLMNEGSVREWLDTEAEHDARRNPQSWPPVLDLGNKQHITARTLSGMSFVLPPGPRHPDVPSLISDKTIALIAHDDMKQRMADFAFDYELELGEFKRILSTGTTGKVVEDAAPSLKDKVHRYNSGPKGGDIEIAVEILYGRCHIVVFFVDPLHPHPHIEDIRVVFGACMIQDKVRMLTNEIQAREWMNRVVRGT